VSGRLAGRVALVTGATGGIGSAICRHLAEAGAAVVVGWRSDEGAARALVASLPGSGHSAVQSVVDDSASLTAAAQHLAARHGQLDLLVNNASFTRFVDHADLAGLDDDLFDAIMRVNVRGAFAAIRACQGLLDATGDAVVVNISSIAGRTGIRVVSVAPGLVEGRYTEQLDPAWNRAQRDATPLGRLAVADDVARAVLAVTAELTHSTGCVIPVDGGRPLS
jgi:3-oxoacyl-[acyl-carrier protein] reductase